MAPKRRAHYHRLFHHSQDGFHRQRRYIHALRPRIPARLRRSRRTRLVLRRRPPPEEDPIDHQHRDRHAGGRSGPHPVRPQQPLSGPHRRRPQGTRPRAGNPGGRRAPGAAQHPAGRRGRAAPVPGVLGYLPAQSRPASAASVRAAFSGHRAGMAGCRRQRRAGGRAAGPRASGAGAAAGAVPVGPYCACAAVARGNGGVRGEAARAGADR